MLLNTWLASASWLKNRPRNLIHSALFSTPAPSIKLQAEMHQAQHASRLRAVMVS